MRHPTRPARYSLALSVVLTLTACGTGTSHDAGLDAADAASGQTGAESPDAATGTASTANGATLPDTAAAIAEDPAACDRNDIDQQTLALEIINTARASDRLCGDDPYPAVPPLQADTRLLQAALQHASDMSTHNFFSHTGSDGSDVAERVTARDFIWRAVGENIAAGQDTLDVTLQGWLESPGHCRNLMNPAYTHMGIACTSSPQSEHGEYWTQVLAAPY